MNTSEVDCAGRNKPSARAVCPSVRSVKENQYFYVLCSMHFTVIYILQCGSVCLCSFKSVNALQSLVFLAVLPERV